MSDSLPYHLPGTPRYALGALTMRLEVRPDQHVLPKEFQRILDEGLEELDGAYGCTYNRLIFLDMTYMAAYLVTYLAEETGRPKEYWLGRLLREYVQEMSQDVQ